MSVASSQEERKNREVSPDGFEDIQNLRAFQGSPGLRE
jgi:hypothetical protein